MRMVAIMTNCGEAVGIGYALYSRLHVAKEFAVADGFGLSVPVLELREDACKAATLSNT